MAGFLEFLRVGQVQHGHCFRERPQRDGEEVALLLPGGPACCFLRVEDDAEGRTFELVAKVAGRPRKSVQRPAAKVDVPGLPLGCQALVGKETGRGAGGSDGGSAGVGAGSVTATGGAPEDLGCRSRRFSWCWLWRSAGRYHHHHQHHSAPLTAYAASISTPSQHLLVSISPRTLSLLDTPPARKL